MKIDLNLKRASAGILVSALAGALVAQPASADTLQYAGPAFGGYISTSGLTDPVSGSPYPVTSSPAAGGIKMNNLTAGGSFAAWCVDIYDWLNTSSSGTSYTLNPGSSFYTSAQVNALERLASQHLGSLVPGLNTTSNRNNSGAFQLAVWEIVNENNTSTPYSLSSGNFRVTSAGYDGVDAKALANTWLSNLSSYQDTMTVSVWHHVDVTGNRSQDVAVFAPIPEPGIYAMLAAGLGMMGFVARRRKSHEEALI